MKKDNLSIVIIAILCILFFCANADINIDLVGFSALLQGMAAIFAVIWGGNEFKDYWSQQRSNAVINTLFLFKTCVANVSDIIDKKDLYQFMGYKPGSYPETQPKELLNRHPERPSRLVYNEVGNLKKGLYKSLSLIAETESIKINDITNSLERSCRNIQAFLWIELGDQPEKDTLRKSYEDAETYKKELHALLLQVETILNPLIKT